MKFRAVILTILILALVGLVALFLQNERKIRALEDIAKDEQHNKIAEQQERTIETLRAELRSGGQTAAQAGGVRSDSMDDAASPAKSDREIELERQLALERQKAEVLEQEAKLILRNEAGKRDEDVKRSQEVDNARVVGKIQVYDKNNNILIFDPVGQPSLVNGQELAIKRNSAIFAYIRVEGLDQESGAYAAEVILDNYFSAENEHDPLTKGEPVIIPPESLKRGLPELEDAQPASSVQPSLNTPPTPDVIPWEES